VRASSDTLLDRVADAYGIEASFLDNAYVERVASPETKRALLAAMGVDASSDGALRGVLEALAREAALPPVVTLRAGEDAALPLPPAARGLPWRLALEDGTSLEGAGDTDADAVLLPAPLPEGYHRLELERPAAGGGPLASLVVAAPARCLLPEDLGIGRCFGVGCQVYALRGARDLGCGDLADLAAFGEAAAREGADFLALNPLHALFFSAPENRSPYAPSSRRFLNWLLIAPDLLPEVADDPELRADLQAALAEARGDDPRLVDHPATAARRRRLLEAAFDRFRDLHLGSLPTPRGEAFLAFRREGGEALERHAVFEALHERALADGLGWAWWEWPGGWSDARGSDVRRFADGNAGRVAFFAWLQWLADAQLGEAQARCLGSGMRVGLYRDLAVGVDPAGSRTWSIPEIAVRGATIGAPPDELGPKGQNWGLAPLAPLPLARAGFAPWLADMRANMRHAGAVRVDHVMGLKRQFWIPAGAGPADGAYVRYPFDATLAMLALESRRASCLVVGEDLGTVPPGFRPALRRAGVLSTKVLYYERDYEAAREEGREARYVPAADYPREAVASVGTHDLPPLKGWLAASEVGWRERIGVFTEEEALAERERRAHDAKKLLDLLRADGVLAPGEDDPAAVALAAHRWLARTPAALVLAQIEDLELAEEQVNLPGTLDEHPNWRRRTATTLADLLASPIARELLAALREERPRV
jgi:4-alpha-glucanotransferase